YYATPDIAPNGDLGMVFLQSSATEYMSMYITVQQAGAPAGTMETPILVAPGLASYRSGRNGDYLGIDVDPVNGTFWAAGEFASDVPPTPIRNNWSTWISNFSTTAATNLGVSTPDNTDTASPVSVTVTARDALNNVATGYTGTVQFTSSD